MTIVHVKLNLTHSTFKCFEGCSHIGGKRTWNAFLEVYPKGQGAPQFCWTFFEKNLRFQRQSFEPWDLERWSFIFWSPKSQRHFKSNSFIFGIPMGLGIWHPWHSGMDVELLRHDTLWHRMTRLATYKLFIFSIRGEKPTTCHTVSYRVTALITPPRGVS